MSSKRNKKIKKLLICSVSNNMDFGFEPLTGLDFVSFYRKSERKRQLEKPKRRLDDNIIMDLK